MAALHLSGPRSFGAGDARSGPQGSHVYPGKGTNVPGIRGWEESWGSGTLLSAFPGRSCGPECSLWGLSPQEVGRGCWERLGVLMESGSGPALSHGPPLACPCGLPERPRQVSRFSKSRQRLGKRRGGVLSRTCASGNWSKCAWSCPLLCRARGCCEGAREASWGAKQGWRRRLPAQPRATNSPGFRGISSGFDTERSK